MTSSRHTRPSAILSRRRSRAGRKSVIPSNRRRFVIQKHDATRLHYDLRLELDGVFKSWAVTRGPSLDPHDKRLAVEVEDHPLDYGDFEGTIPKGQYGGGTVMLWDRGYWEPEGKKSPEQALAKGDFKFTLEGKRLHGSFVLVRMAHDRERGKRTNWLLIKHHDEFAVEANGAAILEENNTSVASGRTMEAIAAGKGRKPKPFMLQGRQGRGRCCLGQPHGPRRRRAQGRGARERRSRKLLRANLPDFIPPQLCETLARPPSGTGWLHEIKFDGYRIQMRVADGEATLKTRKGLDWTAKYPAIARAAGNLPDAIIDGEICALDENGAPDFAALQAALVRRQDRRSRLFRLRPAVRRRRGSARSCRLSERKARLQQLLTDAGEDQPPALRRAFRDRRRGGSALGLPAVARRHCLEARRCALRLRPHRDLGEIEMPRRP